MFFSEASNLRRLSSSSWAAVSRNSCFSASSCCSYFCSFFANSFFLSMMNVRMASLQKM